MEGNLSARDCGVRFCLGFVCIFAALILGEGSARWLALLGVAPVASAVFGHCPGYAWLGLSTARRAPEYVRVRRRRVAR